MTSSWQWHDLHVHTRPHSPDAHWRATLPAMLKQAAKNGVWTVGLANHYFPTTPFGIFQDQRRQLARQAPAGMRVLVGAEVCVLDRQGSLILAADEATQLDFVLAGPHHFKQRWVEQPPLGDAAAFIDHQHRMLLGAVRHPLVDGLAHPWVINIQHAARRWGFSAGAFIAAWEERHFAELGEAAQTHQTAIEIGMGIHLMAEHQGRPFWQKYVRGLQILRECGVKFYFGSDAHHRHIIARVDWLAPTLARLGFTPDDIIALPAWGRGKRITDSPGKSSQNCPMSPAN